MTANALSRVGIPTGNWKVDKAHTRVGFTVKQLGVVTTRGEFHKFAGARDRRGPRRFPSLGWVDVASVDTNPAVVADKVKIVIDLEAVKEASSPTPIRC